MSKYALKLVDGSGMDGMMEDPKGDLFDAPDQKEREGRLYATLDKVAEKFGKGKLSLGLKK